MTNSPEHPGASPVPAAKAPAKTTGKRGYWWSGALVLISALIFGLALLLVHQPIRTSPEVVDEMGWGEAVEFDVADGEEDRWAVYISTGHDFHDFRDCRSGLMNTVEGRYPSIPRESEKGPYGDWELIGVLETPAPGDYYVRCGILSDAPAGSDVEFALGSAGPLHAVQAQESAGLPVVLIGTPLSLIAATVVGVVTALRRRSARKLTPAAQVPAPHAASPQQCPSQPQPPQQHPRQH
ncbi:hypothetical protein [Nocardiopsis metallicus]|uniref:Uncharacterized protein n=1 Tax=Nocardiopsis metallicus TaxID=179819 RepID=A0A840WG81_9ACTN|nr:hypothetical protein [Nocardiopsis metallicus]MBB5494453.1 hypothetical protein [Nocardiopsis metallicus]